jgi:hypothetical protein
MNVGVTLIHQGGVVVPLRKDTYLLIKTATSVRNGSMSSRLRLGWELIGGLNIMPLA